MRTGGLQLRLRAVVGAATGACVTALKHGGLWRRKMLFSLLLAVLSLGFLEILVRLAVRAGLLVVRVYPTQERPTAITFLGDVNPYFGVWHLPNAQAVTATPEGSIASRSNAQGMRDRDRSLRSDARERVVVLGDSFVEGFCVAASNRMTDLIEARTGVEMLNFGVSGGFGSIQEWQLYEHLARGFDHSRVFLFLLPANDFSDNDPEKSGPDRYRPFLRPGTNGFEVYHSYPFAEVEARRPRLTPGRKLRHQLYNHCYVLNLLLDLDGQKLGPRLQSHDQVAAVSSRGGKPDSTYDEYSEADLARLLFSYEQIVRLAAPRPVTIFVIPRERDFQCLEAGRFGGRIVSALQSFARLHPGVEVVDLLPGFVDYMRTHGVGSRDFFLSFDPHWSPLGNLVAADLVLQHASALQR